MTTDTTTANDETDPAATKPPDPRTTDTGESTAVSEPAPASEDAIGADVDRKCGQLDGGGLRNGSRRQPMEPVLWGDGRTPNPASICTARRTNGEPCRKTAIRGSAGPVCATHGGSAPQVKAAARVRIERAADRMAKELLRIAIDEETPAATRLAAIRDALDRSGLGAKTAVEVSVGPQKPWEVVFEDLAGGSRAESRAARGFAGDDALILEAEVVDRDGAGAAGILDGVGSSSATEAPNSAPPQPHSPGPAGNTGGTTVAAGGTGTVAPRQRRTSEYSGTPIVSLADAHPDDEPRRNPHKKNRAISPKSKRERF